MPNKTIVCSMDVLSAAHRQQIAQAAGESTISFVKESELSLEHLKDAHIFLGNPRPAFLQGAENLEWLQLCTAGSDNYASPQVLPASVRLTNATGAFGRAISEYMLGVVLMLKYKLHLYRDNQHEGLWRNEGRVTSLADANVLVLGYGDLGGEFGRKAAALGANVIGVTRTLRQKPDHVQEMVQLSDLQRLLPWADVVAMCLPNSSETAGLMGKENLVMMKEGSILVNVGRGSAVDTEALCDALASGRLGGAALDVTDPEPLPSDHRLYKIKNAYVTPHISGGTNLQHTVDFIAELFADNLDRYLHDKPLRNLVNRETGYMESRK